MRRAVLILVAIVLIVGGVLTWQARRIHVDKFAALDHASAELHAAQLLGMHQGEHTTLLRDVFAEYDVLDRGLLNDAERKNLSGYPAAIKVCTNAREVWGGFEIVPLPFESKRHLYKANPTALESLSTIGIPEVPTRLFVLDDGQDTIVSMVLTTCDAALQSARNGGDEAQIRSAVRSAIGNKFQGLKAIFAGSATMQSATWFHSYVKD